MIAKRVSIIAERGTSYDVIRKTPRGLSVGSMHRTDSLKRAGVLPGLPGGSRYKLTIQRTPRAQYRVMGTVVRHRSTNYRFNACFLPRAWRKNPRGFNVDVIAEAL